MESPSKTIDSLKFEKENAMARFNRVRRVMQLLQIIEVAGVCAAISWCFPAVARTASACLTRLFSHHLAFLIGNAIIMLLLMLCRQSDGGDDLYDDYARHREIARALPPPIVEAMPAEIGGGDCDKQIVEVVADETTESSQSQCDDVAAVIEKAARQMRKLQRNRSEMAKRREVTVVQPELRRSETENRRKTVSSEIENLSSEEFQQRVDAFIDKHWIKTTLEGSKSMED
ncbi:hypothetical protein AAHA92_03801 [Salvia divinorum]|uniref:Uncharacterized protein n=1 Tax=Salvia divinorum TaxID=28513 RepID=A0ABD1HX78_SALDI